MLNPLAIQIAMITRCRAARYLIPPYKAYKEVACWRLISFILQGLGGQIEQSCADPSQRLNQVRDLGKACEWPCSQRGHQRLCISQYIYMQRLLSAQLIYIDAKASNDRTVMLPEGIQVKCLSLSASKYHAFFE